MTFSSQSSEISDVKKRRFLQLMFELSSPFGQRKGLEPQTRGVRANIICRHKIRINFIKHFQTVFNDGAY